MHFNVILNWTSLTPTHKYISESLLKNNPYCTELRVISEDLFYFNDEKYFHLVISGGEKTI